MPGNESFTPSNDIIPANGESMVFAEKMHFACSVYIGILLVVIGLVGNVLSILVWVRPKMRSSTGTFLIGQAIADIGLLIFFFLFDTINMIVPGIKQSYAYGFFFSYIAYPLFFLFVILSLWFIVGVTVDRYIMVCWITQAKYMCTEARAVKELGVITVLCFIVNIPHFATFAPVPDEERIGANNSYRLTEFGSGEGSTNYEFWIHCIVLVLAPWSTIFVLNMLIIQRVTAMNRQMDSKRSFSGKEKAKNSETQLTRLLLSVTFTFLILIAFQCITQCFFMLKRGDHVTVSKAFAIAKLGVIINSAINFFLYCLSAKRFRKELRNMVCGHISIFREVSSSYLMTHSSSSGVSKTKSATLSASYDHV